ncbi:MAG: FecR domain-containing protein [Rhodothermales bacterium]
MPRPRLQLLSSRTWRPVAAAAVLALLLGIGYMLRPITVEAPFGGQAHAVLPDGSNVELNSGSTLSYRATFLGKRTVELDGEAYFDVVEDDNAFVVETINARTTVLGTEFNVRVRSDEGVPVTSVAVASGRVKVDARRGTRGSVIIEPGYRSIVRAANDPSVPAEVALDRELSWREGALAFNGQPFGVIFDEIERRFDVEIDAPLDLRSEPYTVYLHDPGSAEEVISTIAQAHGLRYRATANGYQVYWP